MRDNEHEKETAAMNRRRVLRGAGAAAAGVVGAGVAGVLASTPAQAAPGDPVVQGTLNNQGTATTTLRTDSPTAAPLHVENPSGPGLRMTPRDLNDTNVPAPDGSVLMDGGGDFWVKRTINGSSGFNIVHSTSWVPINIPITPIRVMDTRFPNQRNRIIAYNADTSGRVVPANSNLPDLLLNLTDLVTEGFAVQMTLTSVGSVATGFAAVWGGGEWPGHSSMIFTSANPAATFAQSVFGFLDEAVNSVLSFKVSATTHLIVDVVGLSVFDLGQAHLPGAASPGAKSVDKAAKSVLKQQRTAARRPAS